MKQFKIGLMLLMGLTVMSVQGFPWYVKIPVVYAVYDALLSYKKSEAPSSEPARRPLLLDRLDAKLKSKWYWARTLLHSVADDSCRVDFLDRLKGVQNAEPYNVAFAEGRTHICAEFGKRLATDVVYEAACEAMHQTGVSNRLNDIYKRVTARIGTPSPLMSCIAAGAVRGLTKTAIKKTLDSFDPTMSKDERAAFGFSPLVCLTARFGYDD